MKDGEEAHQVRSSLTRALRDLTVWEMHLDGMPDSKIAELDGRTRRAITDVVMKFKADPPGDAGDRLLNKDPVTIIEDMIRRTRHAWRTAALTAVVADSDTGRVGAVRTMLEADGRLLTLLQSTGRVPKELGTLRHVLDLRAIGERMLNALDSFEAGELDAAGVRAVFEEMVGLGRPQIEGTATEDGA